MIQEHLMGKLKQQIPELSWTIDYYTQMDNTGTVFSEQGNPPDVYDTEYKYPAYQVFIRSSDWDKARKFASQAFDILHKLTNEHVTENGKDLYVFMVKASSDILRLGVDANDIMEYSINFDATIKEV